MDKRNLSRLINRIGSSPCDLNCNHLKQATCIENGFECNTYNKWLNSGYSKRDLPVINTIEDAVINAIDKGENIEMAFQGEYLNG
jgi:hypothetical protein